MHDQTAPRIDLHLHEQVATSRDANTDAGLESRLGLFLGELAHEFGNLAFPLQMILELQSRSSRLSDAELTQILQAHVTELSTMTARFRWIGRCVSGRIEPCFTDDSPVRLVQGAVDAAQRSLPENRRTINSDLSGAPDAVWADRELLQQALVELVNNALRHTPPDGRIDIVVRRQNAAVEFVVLDNGSGIAAELQPRIFDPFVHGGVRLNVGAGQLGCGLTIVRSIAAIHRGSAELRRSTPQGSEFAVSVPDRRDT